MEHLTSNEKQAIRVLNFMALHDSILTEDDIDILFKRGINEFIAPKRRHLVTINKEVYPIRIQY